MDKQTIDRNMRILVLELFWAALATGCYSFASAYLIRLGGTNLQVSMLTSAAALVNALTSIPFALFLERRTNRWRWVVASLWILRLGHIGLVLAPFLPSYRPEAIVLLLLLVNIPVALFNTGWLPMFADLVPLSHRARLLSARNMTMNITVMITTFVMGRWLDTMAFPYNYQLMFIFAVLMTSISSILVGRLVIPEAANGPRSSQAPEPYPSLRVMFRQQRPFVNIAINTLIFNIAIWMATPLQPIYFVRELRASDGWLGIWLSLISAGAILGNLLWPRLINLKGYGWVLARATVLSAAYYFLIALFPNLSLILAFALLFGLISPGVDISHFNTLLEVCDPQRRIIYMSMFVTLMNTGFFLSAVGAAPLLDAFGARTLLLALGTLRLIGGLLFTLNPVHAQSLEQRIGTA